jgi:hypothetical protein
LDLIPLNLNQQVYIVLFLDSLFSFIDVFDYTFDDTFHNTRVGARIDRMRNPWLYIKLKKDSDTDKRVEIHDMVMTYYN